MNTIFELGEGNIGRDVADVANKEGFFFWVLARWDSFVGFISVFIGCLFSFITCTSVLQVN